VKRPLRVGESAAAEFADAVRWHDKQRPGLGADLHELVTAALDFIGEHPDAGSPVSAVPGFSVRRRLIPRFPYQVIYYARPDEIVIVAIAHTSRRPGYWRKRLGPQAT
jgi:toxin ParE1/3/4